MQIRHFEPSPQLHEWIAHYIYIDADREEARQAFSFVPPNNLEGVQFYLENRSSSSLTDFKKRMPRYYIGAQLTRPIQVNIPGRLRLIIAMFHRVRSTRLFRTPMRHFTDQEVGLADLYPRLIREFDERLREAEEVEEKIRLIDNFFLKIAKERSREQSIVDYSVDQIYGAQGNIRVKNLADDLNTTHKTLETHFKEHLGLTPKQYIDVARMNFVLSQLKKLDSYNVQDIIEQTGFYDESHLIKHCKRLVNFTPKSLFGARDFNEWFDIPSFENSLLNNAPE